MNEKTRIFLKEIIRHNQSFDLTSFKNEAELWEQGVKPVIEFYKAVKKELFAKKIADIGAGSGIFGITLLLLDPILDITFIERNKRKAAFIEYILKRLELKARVLDRDVGQVKETFDIGLLRSFTGELDKLRHILKPAGVVFLLMKTSSKFEKYIEIKKVIGEYKIGLFHVEQ